MNRRTANPPKLKIEDQEGIRKAMKEMKPGDQIEVECKGSTMSIGVPSLESDMPSDDHLPLRKRGRCDSWFD